MVDDAVAFSGADVTVRRWDTVQHRLEHQPVSIRAAELYGPYHDVQALVDGNAALALAKLVRERRGDGA